MWKTGLSIESGSSQSSVADCLLCANRNHVFFHRQKTSDVVARQGAFISTCPMQETTT